MEAGHRSIFLVSNGYFVQICCICVKLVTDIRFDLNDYARDDFFRAYTTDLSAVDGNERFFH